MTTNVMRVVSGSQQKRSALMEITIDIPDRLYAKIQKEASRYREDIEELIIRAIEDTYD
jgi:hypothetical protein